jgi:hypothetical protein
VSNVTIVSRRETCVSSVGEELTVPATTTSGYNEPVIKLVRCFTEISSATT